MRTFFLAFVMCWCFNYTIYALENKTDFSERGLYDSFSDTIPVIVVDSSGKLGIGTMTPSEELDVRGNINFTGKLLANGVPGDSGAILMSRGPDLTPVWDHSFRPGVWLNLQNKIAYTEKNVEIGKTLINNADYEGSPHTIFNLWKPKIATTPDLPPFTLTGAEFPNPIPGQPNNYVHNFGINMSSGGGSYKPGSPATGLSFENRFFIDNMPFTEFHILAVDENGNQRRPLTTISAFDGSRNDWSNFVSTMNLSDKDGTKQLYSINTDTEEWNYNGNQLKHIFRSTNYQPFWQTIPDGNETIMPLIGYLGDNPGNIRLQLGNPNGQMNVRFGNSLQIGNSGGYDYFGTAFGDGASSLSFGFEGKKFSSILFNTTYGIVTKMVNNYNSNGWGIGLNEPGAFYLHDFSSNTVPFYLSGNMPDNSFFMSPNGNLCLGCIDATAKLHINGTLKLGGPVILNNLTGQTGQVLVSQGNSAPPVWATLKPMRYEETFIATQGQTAFTITQSLPLPDGNNIPIEVHRNGIKLKYTPGTPGYRKFTYLSNTVVISACFPNEEIEIVYFK